MNDIERLEQLLNKSVKQRRAGRLEKAHMMIDVAVAHGQRKAQRAKKVGALRKSISERTKMENIAIGLGLDPDPAYVNKAKNPEHLKRMAQAASLDSMLSKILAAGPAANGKEIFKKIAALYGISLDSAAFRRANASEGSAGLRKQAMIEAIETLRTKAETLDAEALLDQLLNVAKTSTILNHW